MLPMERVKLENIDARRDDEGADDEDDDEGGRDEACESNLFFFLSADDDDGSVIELTIEAGTADCEEPDDSFTLSAYSVSILTPMPLTLSSVELTRELSTQLWKVQPVPANVKDIDSRNEGGGTGRVRR